MAENEENPIDGKLREWWRVAGVKLAALAGFLSSVATANPDLLLAFSALIPAELGPRLIFAAGVGGLIFIVPAIVAKKEAS